MTLIAETLMLAHGWRRFLMLLVAGAVGGLSVPPFYILPALFVTMPLWVWALDGAERLPGWRRLFGPALRHRLRLRASAIFLVAFHWLGVAFFVEGGAMLVIMPFAILALAALIALFWGLASALAHLFWSPGRLAHRDAGDVPVACRMGARPFLLGLSLRSPRLRDHAQRRAEPARLGHRRLWPHRNRRTGVDDAGADLAGGTGVRSAGGCCRFSRRSS